MLGEPFGGRSAIAIRWGLVDAAPLPSCRASITLNQEGFLEQLGCWGVFTTMIGVADRGAQNIVWSAASTTLAHIDFEDSFRGLDNLQEQLQTAKEFGGLDGSAWRADPSERHGVALAIGIMKGSELLLQHRSAIAEAMQAEGVDPQVLSKALAWVDLPADEKVRRARESVG